MLIGMLDMTQGSQLLSHFQPKGGSNGNRNKHPFRCRSNGAPGFVCKPCSGSGVWAEFADGLRGRILWRQRYLRSAVTMTIQDAKDASAVRYGFRGSPSDASNCAAQ